MVRSASAARVRRAPVLRARAGRRAVRIVRSARHTGREQSVVVVARRGQAPGAGLSRRDARRRRSGSALPLLQPRTRNDALQRRGRSAVGRAPEAPLALRAPDVRLRSPRVFALGRGVRRRALRDRSSGGDRAAAALVGARSPSIGASSSSRIGSNSSPQRSNGLSKSSKRSPAGGWTALRCARGSNA